MSIKHLEIVANSAMGLAGNNKARVENIANTVSSIENGAPKGVYATLAELQSAYPTGAEGAFVVTADGYWYWWDGGSWEQGGVYQSTGIADNGILFSKLTKPVQSILNGTLQMNYNSTISLGLLNGATALDDGFTIPIGSSGLSSYIRNFITLPEIGFPVVIYIKILVPNTTTIDKIAISLVSMANPYTVEKYLEDGYVHAYINIPLCTQTQFYTQVQYNSSIVQSESTSVRTISTSIYNSRPYADKLKQTLNDYIRGYEVVLNEERATQYIGVLNGATRTTFGFNVPSGSTGNTSYAGFSITSNSNYIGEKPTFAVEINTNIDISLIGQSYGALVKKETIDTNQYKIYMKSNSTIVDSTAQIPRISISNSVAFTEDKYLTIENIYYVATEFDRYQAVYSDYIDYLNREVRIHDVHVKSGTYTAGEITFTNPLDATEYCKDFASANDIYNVYIHGGTWNMIDYISLTGLNGSTPFQRGWELPNYVNIIGIGNVLIQCEFEDTVDYNISEAVSTINMFSNNEIKNISVSAKNCRYAIHDDGGPTYTYSKVLIENCIIEHKGNAVGLWSSDGAYLSGYTGGREGYFKNCTFKGRCAFSAHTSQTMVDGAHIEIHNCNLLGTEQSISVYGISNNGMQSSVILNNCVLSSLINVGSGGSYDEWYIEGSGNTEVPYENSFKNENIILTDESRLLESADISTITKGTPLKMNGYRIEPLDTSDDGLYVGVAWDDIAIGEFGAVKHKGYLKVSDTTLTVNVGDKIGIVNGELSVVTSGTVIAICNIDGYILLK